MMRSLMKKSDAELIDAILSGDEDAFSTLVQKYQKSVHALVWRKIGDFHIAEEITQDTFLHVYKKLPTLKNPRQFAGWLYVIVNRQCIAWFRKNNIQAEQSLEATSQETLEETAYACFVSEKRGETEVERRREVVDRLLGKLPESERTVVILHYLGEMSCDAIGKFLGVSPNTVKSRLSRARNRLRENESLIRDTLGSVKLSPNLSDNIMREIGNVSQTSPSGTKPLLPLASLGSSVLLVILLIGASNKYLTHFQLPYSFDALSETTIEIVESPVELNITPKLDVQNQYGNDAVHGKSSNDGLQEGKTSMQNNLAQDSVYWKLPEGAKARLGKGWINQVKYFHDGSRFAVASSIGIWIYNADTGEELNFMNEQMYSIDSLTFSRDGSMFASGDSRGRIFIWDVHSEQHRYTLDTHTIGVPTIAFSPDGDILASGSYDNKVHLWNLKNREQMRTLEGHTGSVRSVTFSPDGKTLASSSGKEGKNVLLWDVDTGKLLKTVAQDIGFVYSLAFSPDGRTLAGGCNDRNVRVWNIHSGKLLQKLEGHKWVVHSILFSSDGQTLVSGSWDGSIRMWNPYTGEQLNVLTGHENKVYSVTYSPDENTLLSAGRNDICIWDVRTGKRMKTITGYYGSIRDIAYSPNGDSLICSASTGIQKLDIHTNQQLQTFKPEPTKKIQNINAMEFTPNADKIVYGGRGKVGLIDADTGIQLNCWESHNSQTPVKLSPNGEKLAIGSNNNRILLVDLKSGDITKTLIDQTTGNKAVIICLAFSLDGNLLACGSSDNKVRIWNMQTDQLLQTLIGHTDLVRSIVFAPNGETVASGGWKDDSKIRLWNVHSGQLLHTIYSTSKRVYSLAYSPDGKILASGNSNGSIGLWDPNTGENIKLLTGHAYRVNSIDYSPDGKTLASVSDDGTVLLWDLTNL